MEVNVLLHPPELSAQVLPVALKAAVIERYEEHLEKFVRPSGWRARPLLSQLSGFLRHMQAEDRCAELGALRARIARLDKARGEDFAAVFPELSELMRS